jgi:ABC-type amino acid transport substrate-binding protein
MFQNGKRSIVLLFYLLTLFSSLFAANNFGYTEEKPLIIVCDWDFRPFEFINAEGQPAGYNVDVLNEILNQLNIPHKFVMQEWHVATKIFKKHEADLIHALYSFYKDAPYSVTHKYINYYNIKVARRDNTKPLNRIANLLLMQTIVGRTMASNTERTRRKVSESQGFGSSIAASQRDPLTTAPPAPRLMEGRMGVDLHKKSAEW